MTSGALGSLAGVATPAGSVPRWADGTPRDRLTALTEKYDIERINSGDARYIASCDERELQELADLQAKDAPHPNLAPGSQAEFEKNRERTMQAERVAQIEAEIAKLEERKAALTASTPAEE